MRKTALMFVLTMLCGVCFSSHAASSFSDVKAGDWFSADVATLSSLGGITGYPDGTFRPNGPITRGEYTSIVARSLGLKPKDGVTGHWSAGIMAAAEEAGLVKAGEYADAAAPITRYEMAQMAVRALEYRKEAIPADYAEYGSLIADGDGSAAYGDDIVKTVSTGILSGYTDRTFQGLRTPTRAEAASVAVRISDKTARSIPSKPSPLGEISPNE